MPKKWIPIVFCALAGSCGQSDKAAPSSGLPNNTAVMARPDSGNASSGAADTPRQAAVQEERGQETALPPHLAPFVPEGYALLDTTAGDLNLDPVPDLVVVLKKKDEETTSDVSEHPELRPLLILLGQADRTYQLAARNDKAVYCVDCGGMMGDPYMETVIKKGYFSVEHYAGSAWRWTRTITFRYAPADGKWYLHKDGGDSFHAAEPEKVKTSVKTVKDFGKVPFEQFDIYQEE